jgi:hypothetical protein
MLLNVNIFRNVRQQAQACMPDKQQWKGSSSGYRKKLFFWTNKCQSNLSWGIYCILHDSFTTHIHVFDSPYFIFSQLKKGDT